MSYATGEAAVLTLLQTLSDWDSDNSLSLANDTVNKAASMLNSGASDRYCFLYPGEFSRDTMDIGLNDTLTEYQTIMEIAILQQPAGNAPEKKLADIRQRMIDIFDQHHTLDGISSIFGAKVRSGGPITERQTSANRMFIVQEVVLQWDEVTEGTQQD